MTGSELNCLLGIGTLAVIMFTTIALNMLEERRRIRDFEVYQLREDLKRHRYR